MFEAIAVVDWSTDNLLWFRVISFSGAAGNIDTNSASIASTISDEIDFRCSTGDILHDVSPFIGIDSNVCKICERQWIDWKQEKLENNFFLKKSNKK